MYKFFVYPSFGYCAKIPSSLKGYHKTGNTLEKGIKGEALEARNSFQQVMIKLAASLVWKRHDWEMQRCRSKNHAEHDTDG